MKERLEKILLFIVLSPLMIIQIGLNVIDLIYYYFKKLLNR